MKKIVSIIGIILIFFLLYFLQINFFSWFNIAGVKPNLFVILVMCTGLYIGKKVAMPLGFIMGFYLDLLTNKQIGISAITYMFIGFLGKIFDNNFSKDNKITILLMVVGSTIIFETIIYFYTVINNLLPLEILGFLKILFIEVIFNVLLTIILYPIIKRIGDFWEDTFKNTKKVSKYI